MLEVSISGLEHRRDVYDTWLMASSIRLYWRKNSISWKLILHL